MPPRSIYRGFSTRTHLASRGATFMTSNVETVKQDLLNHIYTIKGERVMQPGFGTRIPLLAFEPLDAGTLTIVEEDLNEVFTYDPRVELLGLSVVAAPDNNTIIAVVDLRYLELDVRETLKLDFPVGS